MSAIIKRVLLLASLFLFLANFANAQNSVTAYKSISGVGTVEDAEKSSYISPGTYVSWSLSYHTFNVSLDGSQYTNANALILIYGTSNLFNNAANIYVYNTGYYRELDNSASGGAVFSSGGYLVAVAAITSQTQGGGGTVGAYLSW